MSLRRKIKIKKFPFVNGDVSESVDLESGALDCKVYHVEGTRKEPAGAGGATGASHQLRRATNQTTRRGGRAAVAT